MMEFLALLLVGLGIGLFLRNKARKDAEARDAVFRATMLSLEEKAKREGTFVMSYFDSEKK